MARRCRLADLPGGGARGLPAPAPGSPAAQATGGGPAAGAVREGPAANGWTGGLTVRSVTHLLVTNNFAGAERYVCQLANQSAQRDWRVSVIGGQSGRMRSELSPDVTWLPGATPRVAAASLHRLGRSDVVHT